MSAIFAAKYADRIELLTDGARYDDAGRVVDIVCKIWHSNNVPLVFAGRGDEVTVAAVRSAISVLASGNVAATIEGVSSTIAGLRGKPKARPIDGVLAAIVEDRPRIFYFHTFTGEGAADACAPFELVEIESEICLASDPSARDYRDSGLPMFWAIDGLREHGGEFFELLRRHPMKHLTVDGQPAVYGIGGHVDHTVLTADDVAVTRILQWPGDRVGERIEPALFSMCDR